MYELKCFNMWSSITEHFEQSSSGLAALRLKAKFYQDNFKMEFTYELINPKKVERLVV